MAKEPPATHERSLLLVVSVPAASGFLSWLPLTPGRGRSVLRLMGPALGREMTSGGANPLGDACRGAGRASSQDELVGLTQRLARRAGDRQHLVVVEAE
jgi:hypothetical protein